LNYNWILCHVIAIFFEIANKIKNVMALQVNNIITKHGLNIYVLGYVKDERSNLSTMISTLTYVVPHEVLELSTLFIGACWGHAMSKLY
jgi:hypothetical protein